MQTFNSNTYAQWDASDDVMSEINMTPLVDVMLILLIVFMVTMPLVEHALRIELPKASTQPISVNSTPVQLSVDAQGTYALNNKPVPAEALGASLAAFAAPQTPAPALHIRADAKASYDKVAQAMATASQAGFSQIGFVTLPKAAP